MLETIAYALTIIGILGYGGYYIIKMLKELGETK